MRWLHRLWRFTPSEAISDVTKHAEGGRLHRECLDDLLLFLVALGVVEGLDLIRDSSPSPAGGTQRSNPAFGSAPRR